MNIKPKIFCFAVAFNIILVLLLTGCEKVSQDKEVAETPFKNQEAKSETVLKDEPLDTPEYKNLKKQIDVLENEVTKIEIERNKLLKVSSKHSVDLNEITRIYEESRNKLTYLKLKADKESVKAGRKPQYFNF